MESKAKVLGHPVHPMLIVFPLGLLVTGVIFDIIRFATGDGRWSEIAYYTIGAGIIGGLVAAVPGVVDFVAIPAGTRAKRIGLLHGVGNVIVVLLFAWSWLLRSDAPREPETLALILSFAGAALGGVTGWLGGELVDRLGVGVDDGAHLDSPNSLTDRPARERAGATTADQRAVR